MPIPTELRMSNSVRVAAAQMTSINDLTANFSTCSRLVKVVSTPFSFFSFFFSFSLLKNWVFISSLFSILIWFFVSFTAKKKKIHWVLWLLIIKTKLRVFILLFFGWILFLFLSNLSPISSMCVCVLSSLEGMKRRVSYIKEAFEVDNWSQECCKYLFFSLCFN